MTGPLGIQSSDGKDLQSSKECQVQGVEKGFDFGKVAHDVTPLLCNEWGGIEGFLVPWMGPLASPPLSTKSRQGSDLYL